MSYRNSMILSHAKIWFFINLKYNCKPEIAEIGDVEPSFSRSLVSSHSALRFVIFRSLARLK